jgi:hypothetical protein
MGFHGYNPTTGAIGSVGATVDRLPCRRRTAAIHTAVAAINQQIHELAPILNSPDLKVAGSVSSSEKGVPIDKLVATPEFPRRLPVAALRAFASEPDVAVVSGAPDDYAHAHPSRPVLTVEVAESSLALDRQRKGSLYARAGLADYWVLNLIDRVLEVYREPVADSAAPFGWRYSRGEVLDASGRVTALAAPGSSIPVLQLLP